MMDWPFERAKPGDESRPLPRLDRSNQRNHRREHPEDREISDSPLRASHRRSSLIRSVLIANAASAPSAAATTTH